MLGLYHVNDEHNAIMQEQIMGPQHIHTDDPEQNFNTEQNFDTEQNFTNEQNFSEDQNFTTEQNFPMMGESEGISLEPDHTNDVNSFAEAVSVCCFIFQL